MPRARWTATALAGLLALIVTACGSSDGPPAPTTAAQGPSASAAATAPAGVTSPASKPAPAKPAAAPERARGRSEHPICNTFRDLLIAAAAKRGVKLVDVTPAQNPSTAGPEGRSTQTVFDTKEKIPAFSCARALALSEHADQPDAATAFQLQVEDLSDAPSERSRSCPYRAALGEKTARPAGADELAARAGEPVDCLDQQADVPVQGAGLLGPDPKDWFAVCSYNAGGADEDKLLVFFDADTRRAILVAALNAARFNGTLTGPLA